MNKKLIYGLVIIFIFIFFINNADLVYSQKLNSVNKIDFVDGYGNVYYLTKGDKINVRVTCGKEVLNSPGCIPYAYYYFLGDKNTLELNRITIRPLTKDFEITNNGYYIIYIHKYHYFSIEKLDQIIRTNTVSNTTTYPSSSNSYSLAIGPTHINASGNDNYNLNDEWVSIKCASGSVNLAGWKIKDEYGWTYSFPSITIREGQTIKIYTGCGNNTSTSLYWCRDWAVWNNEGDTLYLIKPDGSLYKSWSLYQ
ncbi:MAG: hypothetical protein APG12_01122 [Candidatus Methanofastidiosum methylothiophilum]|uniref:LTD domain-containing protein n=1 Tax=Candidatus Methanofastidiosum methylothiophilum TaxID=1705564 RepID=A0A150IP39_9EURY|nr:MAG: hypothetical protein APG10_01654 [Candidatus Methanofastidiosum methylthiophilus]KYC46717.1 MAG: hypothetical protein APG11_01719 [Candidatus Methanofastidiosum methylthiophilus]KYC49948.1 MAG: hypothetical protein APG12_01122 [Candidatus Methanofastidiosum methylthiophilus]